MTTGASELLRRTPLVVRRGPFALASWPTAASEAVHASLPRIRAEFAVWILDDREVTALVSERTLDESLPAPTHVERGWSLVTLDTPMAWDVVGVLAALTGVLARAEIPVGAYAAFARDHLLVPGTRLEEALGHLESLCGEIRLRD